MTSLPISGSKPTPPTWYEQLSQLYAELEEDIDPSLSVLRGGCCDFRIADHRLYATSLEVEYLREGRGSPIPQPEAEGLCPFWQQGLCKAREHRPLGCRTYFCDPSWRERGEQLHEEFHRRIVALHKRHQISYSYRSWVDAMEEARAASDCGWAPGSGGTP